MIGFLTGRVQIVDSETVMLLTGGVGYEVLCTPNTMSDVEAQAQAELYIHTHVREDALTLFGFSSVREKQVFLSLIKVNGIGPKSALHILAASSVDQLIALIAAEDAKGLSQLPKVGKKTAEQIILTLKGKLVFAQDDIKVSTAKFSTRNDIVSALVHLGFRLNDVEKVVASMDPNVNLESGVREGLLALTT